MTNTASVPAKIENPTVAYLTKKVTQLGTILPKHIPPEKFLRVVFVQMQKNPKLAECTQTSIYSSIMAAGERGLIPDGYHGHLIPYMKRNRETGRSSMECQFIPDYKGLILLARQSGEVSDIFPASIHENDDYTYELGFHRDFVHRPPLKGDRGPIIAVYCVVELKDGTKTFGPGPMTVDEVERIRKRSKASQSGPWVTDWEAMAWKTVIKRTLKFVSQSPELREIIELDDSQYTAEAVAPTAPLAIADLMTEQNGEPETHMGEPAAPEWPKWDEERKVWFDADGVYYDEHAHSGYPGEPRPKVNADGTFKAKRGYAHLAQKLAEETKAKQASAPQTAPEQASGATGTERAPHTITPANDKAREAAGLPPEGDGPIDPQAVTDSIREAETEQACNELAATIDQMPPGAARDMCSHALESRLRIVQQSTGA